jgi:hypothetical protein
VLCLEKSQNPISPTCYPKHLHLPLSIPENLQVKPVRQLAVGIVFGKD